MTNTQHIERLEVELIVLRSQREALERNLYANNDDKRQHFKAIDAAGKYITRKGK